MKLSNIRRIMKEDFDKDYHQLVERLSDVLNPFMEEVITAFDGNVSFENLNQATVKFEVIVNSSGTPTKGGKIKSPISGSVAGVICINVRNLTNTSSYPTSTPFLSTTVSNNIININNITGLTAGDKYQLTIQVISS